LTLYPVAETFNTKGISIENDELFGIDGFADCGKVLNKIVKGRLMINE